MKTVAMMALCCALAACAASDRGKPQTAGDTVAGNAGGMADAGSQWDAVVVAVEPMQASDVGATSAGAIGAAAAGGTMQKGYRVTLRKDDGSTQAVTVETVPGYQIGERVSYRNGSVMPLGPRIQ